MRPLVYTGIATIFVNIICGYTLVYHTSLGYLGAAWSTVITNYALLLFLFAYAKKNGLIESFWGGWDLRGAAKEVPHFFRLGMSGMLMLVFEWWCFEMLAIMSGLLPNAVVIGANGTVQSLGVSAFMFYLGSSVAGGTRLGNALGANDVKRAQALAWMTLALTVSLGTCLGALILIFRHSIPFFHCRR